MNSREAFLKNLKKTKQAEEAAKKAAILEVADHKAHKSEINNKRIANKAAGITEKPVIEKATFKKPILKIVTEKPVVEEKMIEKPVAKKAPAKKKGKPVKK
tara:strand:+ start:99 stop:401 length:303 start_codon:yes stop_codon:yes gene_type:complete